MNRIRGTCIALIMCTLMAFLPRAQAKDTAPARTAVFCTEVFGTGPSSTPGSTPQVYVWTQDVLKAGAVMAGSGGSITLWNDPGKPLSTFLITSVDSLSFLSLNGDEAHIIAHATGGTADVAGKNVTVNLVISSTGCTVILSGDVNKTIIAQTYNGAIAFR